MFQQPDWHNSLICVIALVLGALTLVVLIACANVTTLLLARAKARQQEIAIRLALGAGRTQLIRMLLTETLLLAAIAEVTSLYFAYHLPDLLNHWLVATPFEWPLTPDWRVFAYLTAMTLLAGTLAGLAPSLQSLKVNLTDSLKGRQGLLGATAGRTWLRGLLVIMQVALSFVLLAGAGLFVRTYRQMAKAEAGFETRQVIATRTWVNGQTANRRAWATYHRTLTQRLLSFPGVQSVAYATRLPFAPVNAFTLELQTPDHPPHPVAMNAVSPDFFATLAIPIISGRALRESNPPCAQYGCAAVVSQALARAFWPDGNPLGQTLRTPRLVRGQSAHERNEHSPRARRTAAQHIRRSIREQSPTDCQRHDLGIGIGDGRSDSADTSAAPAARALHGERC